MRRKSRQQLVDDFDAGRTDEWIDSAPVVDCEIDIKKKPRRGFILVEIPAKLAKVVRDLVQLVDEKPKRRRTKAA
jgi:hypothetical protein